MTQRADKPGFFRFRFRTGQGAASLADFGRMRVYQHLAASQWAPRALIEQRQLALLRQLLLHCAQHVPYYRDLLAASNIDPADVTTMDDVRRLPRLERATFQARRPEFRAEVLPSGMRIIGEQRTSGTTGIPIAIDITNMTQLWWLGFFLRDLEWSGIDPRGRRATIKPYIKADARDPRMMAGIALPNWNEGLHRLLETGPAYRMDIQQTPERQLAWLDSIRPDIVMSYTSNLELLGGLVERRGACIAGLSRIQIISEAATREQVARIGRQLGVPVASTYSCVEAGYLASPCPDGHGLHVHSENVLLEVLGDDDRPCAPGESGRVLLTTLHNYASPTIRYEIQDRVTLGSDCPCERGLPLLLEVDGKVRPAFLLPDGRRRSTVEIAQFMMRGVAGVAQYRCTQRAPGHLAMEIVPAADWSMTCADTIEAFLRRFLGSDPAVTITLSVVDQIARLPGGKHRDIVGMP